MRILVINAGSSSIKAMVFDAGLRAQASVAVAEIGGASILDDFRDYAVTVGVLPSSW